jgi:hypothetical protein
MPLEQNLLPQVAFVGFLAQQRPISVFILSDSGTLRDAAKERSAAFLKTAKVNNDCAR